MKDIKTITGNFSKDFPNPYIVGMARLGKVATSILGSEFDKIIIHLYGDLSNTYIEKKFDKALMAGILDLNIYDEGWQDSLDIARVQQISYRFVEEDLGLNYPNTVKIEFDFEDKENIYIIGTAYEDGKILITDINGNKVEFSGNLPTVLIKYIDSKGIISKISSIMCNSGVNIATMKVIRENNIATMVMETDNSIAEDTLDEIHSCEEIIFIKYLCPVEK